MQATTEWWNHLLHGSADAEYTGSSDLFFFVLSLWVFKSSPSYCLCGCRRDLHSWTKSTSVPLMLTGPLTTYIRPWHGDDSYNILHSNRTTKTQVGMEQRDRITRKTWITVWPRQAFREKGISVRDKRWHDKVQQVPMKPKDDDNETQGDNTSLETGHQTSGKQ